MPQPHYTQIIRELPSSVPFVGPEAQERMRGGPFQARIGANESVFGPSPKAIEAIRTAAPEIWKYGDPDNYELRQAVADFHGVGRDNVVIIEGIDSGLGLANRLVVEPGVNVITSDGAYPTFNFHVAACGGTLTKVPYRGDRQDVGGLLDHARATDARIVYLTNPDNPMGSWWPGTEIEHLISALPDEALLLVDEAYIDTAPAEANFPIDVTNPQVLRFRTFSKAYGMAGARIGYCIGEAGVIANFDKIRNHYGISRLGQIAAHAALEDQDYLRTTVGRISAACQRIADIGRSSGLEPLPTATNFVALDCGRDGAYAKAIMDSLLARDIFVRMPGVAPLNRCIRISAGTDQDLDLLDATLPEVMRAVNG